MDIQEILDKLNRIKPPTKEGKEILGITLKMFKDYEDNKEEYQELMDPGNEVNSIISNLLDEASDGEYPYDDIAIAMWLHTHKVLPECFIKYYEFPKN